MNIDNQLILGIVFITAGIAMALLAYAALLNRNGDGGEDAIDAEEETAFEPAAESSPAAPAEAEVEVEAEADIETLDEPAIPPPELAPPDAEPASTVAEPASPVAGPAPAPEPRAPAPESSEPAAVLRRDPATGRLVIQVEDATYRSIEEMRESDDWDRVDHLFSDLLAWLYRDQAAERAAEAPSETKEAAGKKPAAMSMVEQINEILAEKLASQPESRQAIHLLEGPDGGIRVYIGVNSYSIEQVPDAQVRALIRQAVAEWESRQ